MTQINVFVSLEKNNREPYISARINKDGISGPLKVRSKRDGDTVRSGGMTKKLKRIFCDMHIPSHLRNEIPIVEDDLGIVLVGGILIRDGCRPVRGKEDLTIQFYKQSDINEEDHNVK